MWDGGKLLIAAIVVTGLFHKVSISLTDGCLKRVVLLFLEKKKVIFSCLETSI